MDADLEAVAAGFEPVLAGRTAADCQLHPKGDARRWNAGQIVAHLALTYETTGGLLRKRLEVGRPSERLETLTQRFLQWLVIGRGWLPSGARAPDFALPEKLDWSEKSGTELVDALRAGLEEMDGLLADWKAKFGESPVGTHFLLGPLTATQWRRFHRVHGLHHLRQLKTCLK